MFSTKNSSVVGLDIEAGSIAATEVSVNGSVKVARTAIGELTPGAFDDGEVRDSAVLSSALRKLFSQHKLSKSVRLGVANQRVSVRTLRLPLIEDPKELDTAVRFQAQDELPMPLDQAVIDFQVVNRESDEEGRRQMDVVVVAARRDMLTALAESLRGAGLRPVGIDLSAFALIRALAGGGSDDQMTSLYCHVGDVTNLAVARGSACIFTRVSPFGIEGLDGSEAVADVAAKLVAELRLTLEFYGAQDGAPAVDRLVLCGPGSTVSGLADHLESALGYRVDEERPDALASLSDGEAARLTVSYGLALEDVVGGVPA
jgi:type IV pilus assembly protein PilM